MALVCTTCKVQKNGLIESMKFKTNLGYSKHLKSKQHFLNLPFVNAKKPKPSNWLVTLLRMEIEDLRSDEIRQVKTDPAQQIE